MMYLRPLAAASKMLLALTLLLGVLYPLAVTGVGRLMPDRADGSILFLNGRPVGSSLLGQDTTDPRLFQGRPSASQYAGDTSGGSNLTQNSPDLAAAVAEREAALRASNPEAVGAIPPDALTASASGLDPHISPAYAEWQAPRVATATGLPLEQVRSLIDQHTSPAALGFIGADSVNVTELNVSLAALIDERH